MKDLCVNLFEAIIAVLEQYLLLFYEDVLLIM